MATRAAGDAYWERTDLERRILEAMRAVMEAAGFAVHAWDDVT